MFRFEQRAVNPDQDLNRLWWDLVERYQELRRPEGRDAPDYAEKIHIVMSPVYYHNYMLGELFAAQLHHAIARDVLGGVAPRKAVYVGNPAVGRFMIIRVFRAGPDARLVRLGPPRHRRRFEPEGVCGRYWREAVTAAERR